MEKNKVPNFNTLPLLNEIESVLNNGISNILNDFSERYNLLEKTQSKILKLLKANKNLNYKSDSEDSDDASVCNEVNNNNEEEEEEVPIFVSMKDLTEELVKNEISHYQNKMENKFNKFVDDNHLIIHKLIDQVDSLKQEILKLPHTSQKIQESKVTQTLEEEEKIEEPEKIKEPEKIEEPENPEKIEEDEEGNLNTNKP